MKPAISNMWANIQGLSRAITQTVIDKYNGQAIEGLLNSGTIVEDVGKAMRCTASPINETIAMHALLACSNDCLSVIAYPFSPVFQFGETLSTLNLNPL